MNNSIMFQEIQEEPVALRECIEQNQVMVKFLAEEIRSKNPSYLVLAARGTSCNAAKFAKYVFETYVGLPVMIAAPSVLTKYGGKLKLSNAVVVGIFPVRRGPGCLQPNRQKPGRFADCGHHQYRRLFAFPAGKVPP